jgi:hypothetical protein
VRKHGRNVHGHAINGSRHRDEMPGPPLIDRLEALRSVGEVVYAARVGHVVKIGHTTDLASRLRAIAADELLAFAPGSYADEQCLHRRLVEHLHHGREWYFPTPGVLAVVNELRSSIGLEPLAA